MSTQSNAIPESIGIRQSAEVFPRMQIFLWSVRRELWEYRSIYIAPLAVAGVFLLGFMISLARLPYQIRAVSALGREQYRDAIAHHYEITGDAMMAVGILLSLFYCMDALYGERRDRSILFWKSLPVSDWTTVLAKASIPLVVIPALMSAIGILLQFVMLVFSTGVLLANGMNVVRYWQELSFFQMSLLLIYHIFTAHAIWPAPIYAWILLVSGWARRAVLLWAALPIVTIAGLELLIFQSTHFAALVGSRLIGNAPAAAIHSQFDMSPTNPMTHITPAQFMISPGLWFGLLITVAFLAMAVKIRRIKGPL